MEEPTAMTGPAPPQVVYHQPEPNNRTPFWILLSVTVGFLLPVCACGVLLLTSIAGIGALGAGGVSSSDGRDAVAIVRVEGAITNGDETDFGPGAVSGVVMGDLRAAAEDETVKAIVLRVDSPGGGVTGSAQIYEVVQGMDKPVVVSMSSVAASGGYYVSAPADYIFARADTVTGSIGVIYTLLNVEELIDEVGIDVELITSGENKGLGSPFEELTPEQRGILQGLVEETYDEFVRIVAEGRNLSQSDVRQLADGRIYSGRQALAVGLVDELGNLQNAIDKAADLGGIVGEPRIVEYEHIPTLRNLLGGLDGRINQSQAEQILITIQELTTPMLEYRYIGPGQ